jgi:diadenosine tetraphosphate (Ap4A) HIT family hydrolase
MIGSIGLRVARSRPGGGLVALVVRHGALRRLLGLRLLAESAAFVAFPHPRPHYPTHVLLVSTMGVRDFLHLDADGLAEALALAEEVGPGGALVTNLGSYQDVRLLHLHLIPPGEVRVKTSSLTPLDVAHGAAQRRLDAAGACRVFLVRTPDAAQPWAAAIS